MATSDAATVITASAEIASIATSGIAGLPFCGPVVAIIESTLDTIRTKKEVEKACGTDIPADLKTMKMILEAMDKQLPAASSEERSLFDESIQAIRSNLVAIESVITSFVEKSRLVKTFTSKAIKAKLACLYEELGKAEKTLRLLLVIFPRDSKASKDALDKLEGIAVRLEASSSRSDRPGEKIADEREMAKLEEDYIEIDELMQELKQFRSRLGKEQWATAIIPLGNSPALVTDEERADMYKIMKKSGIFWKGIQNLHKQGINVFEEDTNWVQRGRSYRALVEPLDIANWYYREKNAQEKGHYVDDIEEGGDELFDNDKRPGRYILLQRIETMHTGKPHETSLATARKLKGLLGETSWRDYVGP